MGDAFYRDLPCLETDRLIIRKFTLDDVDDYFSFAHDPEVTQYLRWGPHPTREHTLVYLQSLLVTYANGSDSSWGIELKAEKKLVGLIHLMQLDRRSKKAQIGYVLSRSYWNQGLMTEALRKVIDYCFMELMLNRIEAFCICGNKASARVMEKAGMQQEGFLRQYLFQKGRFWDFQLFAILRSDWDLLKDR